jgi:WD40 repeat protein
MLLNEQRLVEFFWDIVLANTTDAVTIFFDEAERAIDLAFSSELFAALQSCYMRRVSEPDYARLNFVVLGAATPSQLCPDPSVSAFAAGVAVRLDDFTEDECLALVPRPGQPASDARQLIELIYGWTRGQPYLTQKLARGVARRGGQLSDVDAVAHDLFLAPGISREEPYLTHMRKCLDEDPRGRQARAILTRLARGGEVIDDRSSPAQRVLDIGGFVSSDENGMLRFRNRIVERVFDERWSRSVPAQDWQRPARFVAIALALLVAVSFWYVRVLPRPYIDTLTFVSSDYALAAQAHRRLHRIPGFGRLADRMLTDVIVSRSTGAESIVEVRAADATLRELPNSDLLADRLMADYWLRQSDVAAHRGERDTALANALAAIDAGSDAAVPVALNLIDGDYPQLEQSFQVDVPVLDFEVDWERNQIVGIDQTQRLFRVPLDPATVARPNIAAAGGQPVVSSLTALQQVGVTRGLFVDEPGRAGSFQFRVTVDHPRTSDLLVRLRAPSGAAAEVALLPRDGVLEQFAFTASADNGLARLADEAITGQWELTVFDRLSGETGRLVSWGMVFPGVSQDWTDEPVDGIPLPDPVRTEQVTVALSGDGRKAVAFPSRSDVRGAASVFDVGTGAMLADLALADRANFVRFIAADYLLVVGPLRTLLWRVDTPSPIAEIVTAGGFAAPPAVSPDGRFFAVAESVSGRTRVTLTSVADGLQVSRFTSDPWAAWALAADARYLAVVDGSRRGRLLDPLTGESLADFYHERGLDRVIAASDRVVAVDALGQIVSWPFADGDGRRTLTPVDSIQIGTTLAADRIRLAADGTTIGYVDASGLVALSNVESGYRLAVYDHGPGSGIGLRLSPGSDRLVSAAGTDIRSWHVSPGGPRGPGFGDVSAVAMDGSGALAVLGYRSGKVQLLRGLPGSIEGAAAPTVDYIGHRGVVTSLAVNDTGNLVASGASDGLVRVWNAATGMPRPYLLRHPAGPIDALAFSPDNRWLVSTAAGTARVFDLATGERVNDIEVDGEALAVDFAPDSRVVAVGDSAGNIVLVAPDGSQGVLTIRGRSPITALRYSNSASVLASGTRDGNLVVWDTLEVRAIDGAYSFAAPIRWIDFRENFEDLFVQSGAWLYQLDRSATEPGVVASTLLPNRFRNDPALSRTGRASIRALAHAGGGRLAIEDIEMLPAAAFVREPVVDRRQRSELLDRRDWSQVLGLKIDPVTGLVRPSGP